MKFISSYPAVFLQLFILALFFGFSAPAPAALISLDAASTRCLTCHEGAIQGGRVCHKGGCDHPIGVDYVSLAQANRTLAPPSTLNPSMLLADGMIGCLTCHVPYDKSNHLALAKKRGEGFRYSGVDPMLSVDNNGSALCLSCHRK